MKNLSETSNLERNVTLPLGANETKDSTGKLCSSASELTLEIDDSKLDNDGDKLYGVVNSSSAINKLDMDHSGRRDAEMPPSSNTSSGQSSTVSLAPKWVYGTTILPSNNSNSYSSVSGLCLSERGHVAVAQPEVIQNVLFPTTITLQEKIVKYRQSIGEILSQDISTNKESFQSPLLVITGPKFITDPNQAKACAQWIGGMIGKQFDNFPSDLLPEDVLNLYRPGSSLLQNIILSLRTNLTNYNHNNDAGSFEREVSSLMTYEVEQGIPICRALLCELAEICPIVGEISDTITPQYFSDLFCLGIVNASLNESQIHRELVSGISYAIGFHTMDSGKFNKEMYIHKITSALDAMYAASHPHQFLSVTKIGTVAVVGTIGNDETFIILLVNLELDYLELIEVIKHIYNYSSLNTTRQKIMLDVGKVSNDEFEAKRNILRQLFTNDEVKYKIIGVLIDSGDNYIPHNHSIELNTPQNFSELEEESIPSEEFVVPNISNKESENLINHQKLITMNNYFIKNRIFKRIPSKDSEKQRGLSINSLSNSSANLDKYYELFINADKIIRELECMSSLRINSLT